MWVRASELTFECNQVSRSSSVPPNTRDTLYQGLPPGIKAALRSKLQSFQVKEEVSVVYLIHRIINKPKLYISCLISPLNSWLRIVFPSMYWFITILFKCCSCSIQSLKSKLKWRKHCSGLFPLPLIQQSKALFYLRIYLFYLFLFVLALTSITWQTLRLN